MLTDKENYFVPILRGCGRILSHVAPPHIICCVTMYARVYPHTQKKYCVNYCKNECYIKILSYLCIANMK